MMDLSVRSMVLPSTWRMARLARADAVIDPEWRNLPIEELRIGSSVWGRGVALVLW